MSRFNSYLDTEVTIQYYCDTLRHMVKARLTKNVLLIKMVNLLLQCRT